MQYEKDVRNDEHIVRNLIRDFRDCLRGNHVNEDNMFHTIVACYVFCTGYKKYRTADLSYKSVVAQNEGLDELDKEVVLAVNEIREDVWNRLEVLAHQYVPEHFAKAITEIDFASAGRYMAEDYTPVSAAKLGMKLLDIKQNEKVADIFSGVGMFITNAASTKPDARYYGFDINRRNSLIARIRARVMGLDVNITEKDIMDFTQEPVSQFDKIFANYPLRAKYYFEDKRSDFWDNLRRNGINIDRMPTEWIFNMIACNMMSEEGKAVAVMSDVSLTSKSGAYLRQYFVEEGLVEAIIHLPEGLFNSTALPLNMVVFSHGNNKVKIVDATGICQKTRRASEFSDEDIEKIIAGLKLETDYSLAADFSELRENEYILYYNRYKESEISFKNAAALDTVVKVFRRGVPIVAGQMDELASPKYTGIQYLQLSNIQDGIVDDNLVNLKSLERSHERYCLKNHDLLISKIGLPYKTAVVEVGEGKKIVSNGNIYALELDESKIDPYYLQAFFESETGAAVLRNISSGGRVMMLTLDQLKNLMIPVPPLEEQKEISREYRKKQDVIRSLKLQLENALSDIKNFFNQ